MTGDNNPQLLERVKGFVNDWFDLGPDLQPFYDLLAMDSALAYMPAAFNGLRLIGIPDLFEALCWAVTGQQINLTFAHKLKRRLVEAYGDYVLWQGERYYTFPDAAVIATLLPDDLRPMQFSASKANYLINIARAFADGSLDKGKLLQLSTFAERQQCLTAIKGIGTWTANYVLMKSLKDPSSIPYGDAGLNNTLIRHGLMQSKTDLLGLNTIFQKFTGWEAYLVIYLWRSLAPMPSAGQ